MDRFKFDCRLDMSPLVQLALEMDKCKFSHKLNRSPPIQLVTKLIQSYITWCPCLA